MKYEPRHVYVISFDDADTDLKYICSHADQVLDGVAEADIFYGDIIAASTHSQRLNPIRANADIGEISFTFLDDSSAFTSLLNTKLLAGEGLRGKRVQHWVGERGAEWSSDYTLIQTQQIHGNIEYIQGGNGVRIMGRDIQRSELEEIFDPIETTLTSTLTKTGITINVKSTTGIDLIQHGASYSDAPNAEVLYVKIKDEIIRCTAKASTTFTVDNSTSTLNGAISVGATSIAVNDASGFDSSGVGYIVGSDSPQTITEVRWSGISDSPQNVLTGVTGVTSAHANGDTIVAANGRGVLGSVPALHNVDTSQAEDRRPKVSEFIYYELPAMKLAYAILTGVLYGSADTIPAHHTLDIGADWVSTTQFTQYGDDIWDSSDDTAGVILRFAGLKKVNAKKFIEEELNFWCGVFNPILNTGELGLKKMAGVLSDSAYVDVWNEDNIISISSVKFDFDDIHNNVAIDWNYDPNREEFTRHIDLTDSTSVSAWGASKTLSLESQGLHGSRHTDNILASQFNIWRDRHAGPPFKATVVLDYSQRFRKVGEVVRLQVDSLRNFTDAGGSYNSLDLSVEIQRVSIDFKTGRVTCQVFGSTSKAATLALGSDSSPIAGSWFTSQGSDISGVSTVTGSAGGGIFTITANSSLTGVADLNSATATTDNDQGIFYYDGDLVINSGVTLTISDNVELRVNGTITNNGKIDGKGNGLSATTSGQAGYIGNTKAGGGIEGSLYGSIVTSYDVDIVEGLADKAGPFIIENSGGTAVNGRPSDLRGSSGGQGGYAAIPAAAGSAGGDGGAGLAIYAKSTAGGINSDVDLSGNDGTRGTFANDPYFAGSGGGGYAGSLFVCLIGTTATETLSDYFTANVGDSPAVPGNRVPVDGMTLPSLAPPYWRSFYDGYPGRDVKISNLYVDYMPDNLTAEADVRGEAIAPSAISITAHNNTPQTPAENLTTLEITITPPVGDTTYSHAYVVYKIAGQSNYEFEPLPNPIAKDETTAILAMDGTTYIFRAYSVNFEGVQSDYEFAEASYTVDTQIGGHIEPSTLSGRWSFLADRSGDGTGTYAELTGVLSLTTTLGHSASSTTNVRGDTGGRAVQFSTAGIGLTDDSNSDEATYPQQTWVVVFYMPTTAPSNGSVIIQRGGAWGLSTHEAGYSDGKMDASFDCVGDFQTMTDALHQGEWHVAVITFDDSASVADCYIFHSDNTYDSVTASTTSWTHSVRKVAAGAESSSDWSTTGLTNNYFSGGRISEVRYYREYVDFGKAWNISNYFFNSAGGADANNTNEQLELGETITGGGLTFDAGGAISSAGKTPGSGSGVYLGYSALVSPGSYLLDVGNHNTEKYIYFNGDDLLLGREVYIRGASGYNNDSIYWESWFEALDAFSTTTGGDGAAAVSAYGLQISGSTASSYVETQRAMFWGWSSQALTWDADRNLKFWFRPEDTVTTGHSINIGSGVLSTTTRKIGVRLSGSMSLVGFCHDGSSESTATLQTLTADQTYEIEIVHDESENTVKFYVDGTLLGTISSNIPSGSTNAEYMLSVYAAWPASSPASVSYRFPRWKFWQDF